MSIRLVSGNFLLMISKWKDIWVRFSGKGIYPHKLAFLLDTPIRKFIISPIELAEHLHLNDNSKVLEIGSGPGYFSIEIAKIIKEGFIILFDIQHEMLLKCSKKISTNNIGNAFLTQGNAEYLPFKSDLFDRVFLVTVLGEVSNPRKCIESVSRILRSGGILSITEMKGDPDLLTFEELNSITSEFGFVYSEIFYSKKGSTINFKKL